MKKGKILASISENSTDITLWNLEMGIKQDVIEIHKDLKTSSARKYSNSCFAINGNNTYFAIGCSWNLKVNIIK